MTALTQYANMRPKYRKTDTFCTNRPKTTYDVPRLLGQKRNIRDNELPLQHSCTSKDWVGCMKWPSAECKTAEREAAMNTVSESVSTQGLYVLYLVVNETCGPTQFACCHVERSDRVCANLLNAIRDTASITKFEDTPADVL